jgi:hypothetical protein
LSAAATGLSVALDSPAVVLDDVFCAAEKDAVPAVSTAIIAAFRKMLVMFTSRFLAEIKEYVFCSNARPKQSRLTQLIFEAALHK